MNDNSNPTDDETAALEQAKRNLAMTELHNHLAPEVVAMIIANVKAIDGRPADAIVICESIVAGCIFYTTPENGTEPILNEMMRRVRERVDFLHAKKPPEGFTQ